MPHGVKGSYNKPKGNSKGSPTPGNASGPIGTRHWGGIKGSVSSKKFG